MLSLENITKIYGDGTVGLYNFSYKFPNHGFYCILGESGSGKSTLVNIIASVLSPTSGDVLYQSRKYCKMDLNDFRRYEIGIVFQYYNLIKRLTVKENLLIPLKLFKIKNKEEKIQEVLKLMGLEGYDKKPITELSGGEMQRVAIASAILKNPKIIILDEPTSNLDDKNSIRLFDILKKLSKNYLIIMATHNEVIAKEYADTIIRLEDGKMIEDLKINVIEEKPDAKKRLKKSNRIYFDIFKLIFNQKLVRKLLFVLMIAFSLTVYSIGILHRQYNKDLDTLVTNTKYYNDELQVSGLVEKIDESNGRIYKVNKNFPFSDFLKYEDILLKGVKHLDYDTNNIYEIGHFIYNGRIKTTIIIPSDYVIPNLLVGRSIENPGEIVITDHVAENIIHYTNLGNTYSDLINKEISLVKKVEGGSWNNPIFDETQKITFKIVGIKETVFTKNYKEYKKNPDENPDEIYMHIVNTCSKAYISCSYYLLYIEIRFVFR